MEQISTKKQLHPKHNEYWMDPIRHGLVRETENRVEYYSIYQLQPKLMMMLCDDFEYALQLSKKMIENGVRVFDNFSELYNQANVSNNPKNK